MRMSKEPMRAKIDAASKRKLTNNQQGSLLRILKSRFEKNMERHQGLDWADVEARLTTNHEKLWSLYQMEKTGGEPDIIGYDSEKDLLIFCDCSPESPVGRRSLCYDREGEMKRVKQNVYPAGNAVDMAEAMGVELLTEEQYRGLQKIGSFDTRTSSWIKTPQEIRRLGGALFAERRYGVVFVFHNTASSFYQSRAFRGMLVV